jgi:hypothetical protein
MLSYDVVTSLHQLSDLVGEHPGTVGVTSPLKEQVCESEAILFDEIF